MNIFFSIFESVGVLLCLGCIGFYIIGKRIIPGNVLGLLSPLVLDIALPSLIFVSIINKFTLNAFSNWWTLPLWWIGFSIAALTLTLTTMFLSEEETRREFAISLFYQNGIFFPLAVITGLYGSDSTHLVSLFLFISFHPALFFSTYHFFFSVRTPDGSDLTVDNSFGIVTTGDTNSGTVTINGTNSGTDTTNATNSGTGTTTGEDSNNGTIAGHQLDWKKIIHPVLIMTIIALLIRLADVQKLIPGFIIKQLSLLGGMTLPLIMIILGGNIYLDFQKKGRFQAMEIIKFVLVKNFLFPLVFLGGLILIRPPYHIALIILLQSAVSPHFGDSHRNGTLRWKRFHRESVYLFELHRSSHLHSHNGFPVYKIFPGTLTWSRMSGGRILSSEHFIRIIKRRGYRSVIDNPFVV